MTLRNRSRATLSAMPRSRSTPISARRWRSKRVIEAGPRPNSTSATAVSGIDFAGGIGDAQLLDLLHVGARRFFELHADRNLPVADGELCEIDFDVADGCNADRFGNLIGRNAEPGGRIEARHDADFGPFRSSPTRQRCGSPEPGAARPRPCRLRRSSRRRFATAWRTTARARRAR